MNGGQDMRRSRFPQGRTVGVVQRRQLTRQRSKGTFTRSAVHSSSLSSHAVFRFFSLSLSRYATRTYMRGCVSKQTNKRTSPPASQFFGGRDHIKEADSDGSCQSRSHAGEGQTVSLVQLHLRGVTPNWQSSFVARVARQPCAMMMMMMMMCIEFHYHVFSYLPHLVDLTATEKS